MTIVTGIFILCIFYAHQTTIFYLSNDKVGYSDFFLCREQYYYFNVKVMHRAFQMLNELKRFRGTKVIDLVSEDEDEVEEVEEAKDEKQLKKKQRVDYVERDEVVLSDSDEDEPVNFIPRKKEVTLKNVRLCEQNKPNIYPYVSMEPTRYFENILNMKDANPSDILYTGETFELTRADLLKSVFSESFLKGHYVNFSALKKSQRVYEWANDTMIDSYMSLLDKYYEQKYFFSCARFASIVLTESNRFSDRWKSLYKCAQFLLFPLNVNDNHWTFVYADATDANNKTFAYVDTLKGYPDIVLNYGSKKKRINAIDEIMKFWCLVKNDDFETVKRTWKIRVNEFPKQPDFVSCGFFVCEFAKYAMLKWHPPDNISTRYVDEMRKNVAYEILTKNILC